MNKTLRFGLCAFAGTLFGNFVTMLVFEWPSARFFTPEWLQNWTMIYIVWLIFIAIGLVSLMRKRSK